MNTTTRVLLVAALCTFAVACSKKVKEDTQPVAPVGPSAPADTAPVASGVYGPSDLDTDPNLRQRVIYFDFDQYTVRPEYQAVLAAHAKYMRDRPSARLTLEGHADERGSREYNLGLGERRGNAVSSTLQANGGAGAQLTVVSYGEERPAATGSSEESWAQNRRVEIVYTAK